MSSLDYLDLCRLCLVKDRVSVPIFEGEGDVRQIFLKISACLPVKVNREDKLPKKICDDCVYKVELLYQFWNTTANAEKQLLQWLGEVNMEEKQGYAVGTVLNPTGMKPEQSNENRLDGSVMQQIGGHQNNMNMGMIDNMGVCMPMMMSNSNQQITSVPMDNSGNSVQSIQSVPGPSTQTAHDQITENQTNTSTQQEEEEESSEEEENSDDECDGDEGLPIKEESEEDPNNGRTIEPTTFVNVSLACDEAGPSGLQQQKIADMPEMVMPQTGDVDPKTGFTDLLEINDIKIEGSQESHHFLARISADTSSIESSKENKRRVRKALRVHYACNICSFLCRTKGSLRKHAQLHRNTCRMCGERFTAIDKLEIHMVVNHGEAKYSCQLCYSVFWSVPDMTEHFSTRHLDPTHNNCSICNKEYKSKICIQRHMYKHHCSVSVACTICRRVYKSIGALKSHTRLVHLKSGYQCGICKRRVATSASLEAHMRRHEDRGQTNPDTYVCTTCGETFLNKRDLKSHVSTHGRIKPHVCPVCRKAFEERRVQVQHILTHMNTPLYVCDVCGMKYSRRATLLRHRSTHPGPLGALPEIPVTDIVSEFVRNYLNESKNLSNS